MKVHTTNRLCRAQPINPQNDLVNFTNLSRESLPECSKEQRTMGIIAWIVVGLIAGWLAGLVMKGGGYGVVGDIIVGIVGGLIGGFLASVLFGAPNAVNGIDLTSIVTAFVGAVILIAILRALPGRSPV
jgi:uncharacterized membrane protein YeaQ/YmgE (transglycosylase-associated protein family)